MVVLVMALSACSVRRSAAPPVSSKGAGVVHQVRTGETLYRIGKAYGVPYQQIARANGIRDPSKIEVGQRLVIPGAAQHVPADLVAPLRATGQAEARDPRAPQFHWPIPDGIVTSAFGPRRGTVHDGIDIGAPVGAPVRAAADGEVAYSAALPGYGNVVILRHAAGYATVYAHNDQNDVREGQRVKQGQLIAKVGRSGRTTGPNLHFEVRRENIARNPIYFLPLSAAAATRRGAVAPVQHHDDDVRLTAGR